MVEPRTWCRDRGRAVAVVVPIRNPAYRVGFLGNLVSSIWQLIFGAVVAWIVLNRFKTERFNRVMSISWDYPFREIHNISLSLYPMAIGEAAELRTALDAGLRQRLREAATRAHRKGALYGRFFEIEQLVDIDRSCDAAEGLANLDDQLPEPKFMRDAIDAISEMYVWSARVRGFNPSQSVVEALIEQEEMARLGSLPCFAPTIDG